MSSFSQNYEIKESMKNGLRDSIPIGLGYLAVSFSLGIMAKKLGLSPFQGFLMSLLNNASAGEYAGLTVIGAASSLLEIAIITLIANARYLLMSCSISQRMSPDLPLHHRLLIAFDLTDELFAIAIARPGYINPYYSYGAILFAAPCWAGGTALGVIAGNVLSARIVSALSVALYGMFIAIIIPPAKKDRFILIVVLICFVTSGVMDILPVVSKLSSGSRTIILTLVISTLAALIHPVPIDNEEVPENEN